MDFWCFYVFVSSASNACKLILSLFNWNLQGIFWGLVRQTTMWSWDWRRFLTLLVWQPFWHINLTSNFQSYIFHGHMVIMYSSKYKTKLVHYIYCIKEENRRKFSVEKHIGFVKQTTANIRNFSDNKLTIFLPIIITKLKF